MQTYHISEHNHVKPADIVLKYALTCAVRGAILANKNASIKLFYQKISKKGVSPQKAQIAVARKVACIVWKVLSSKQPYTEQDDHMTKRRRKMKIMSSKAMRIIPTSVMPSKVSPSKGDGRILAPSHVLPSDKDMIPELKLGMNVQRILRQREV
jgi:hypothetical protein